MPCCHPCPPSGPTLRVRLQQGDAVVELEGDADTVRAEVDAIVADGYGHLLDFFGAGSATGAGSSGGSSGGGGPGPGGGGTGPPAPLVNPARVLTFALSTLTVPKSRSDFALDLDGDGHPDNQFGSLVGILMAQGMDVQGWVDQTVGIGAAVLLRLATADNDLTLEQRADLTVAVGTAAGGGTFTVDPHPALVTIAGQLSSGRFSAAPNPNPTPVPLALPLVPNAPVGRFPLHGPQVTFTVAADGSGLSAGQINGGIATADYHGYTGPALAASFTSQLASGSSAGQLLATIFDTGGCVNPDGTTAVAGDGRIDVCEVLTNPVMGNLLASDVRLYDTAGHYSPGPGTPKDSVSIGLGFSATPATF
jgi:hypothetical protein